MPSQNTSQPLVIHPKILRPEELLKRMFESQSGDWEIAASDGKTYKFHMFVLEEQLEYFRAISFHKGTVESDAKRIIVPVELNISGAALDAFLRYIYYKDWNGMCSFSTTCALIRAGDYYLIPDLIDAAALKIHQSKAHSKPALWFNLTELWDLYQYVWLWGDKHPSKGRLIKSIVEVIKIFCKNREDHFKLLALADADGSEASESIIQEISKCNQNVKPVSPYTQSPPAKLRLQYNDPFSEHDLKDLLFEAARGAFRQLKSKVCHKSK